MTTKEQILESLSELPDDATVEDAIDRLVLLAKLKAGSSQAHRGEVISQEESRSKFAQWLGEHGCSGR